jgi:hypothetical protein
LQLCTRGHLILHLQLAVGSDLLARRHLILHLYLAIGLNLLTLRHLRLHPLLCLCLLHSGVLRLCHLDPSLLDPVCLHLALANLRHLARTDLRLGTLRERRAVHLLRALHGNVSAAAGTGSKRARSEAAGLHSGPAASRRTGSCKGNAGSGTATTSTSASGNAYRGCASAARSAASVVAARAGSGRCGDR